MKEKHCPSSCLYDPDETIETCLECHRLDIKDVEPYQVTAFGKTETVVAEEGQWLHLESGHAINKKAPK